MKKTWARGIIGLLVSSLAMLTLSLPSAHADGSSDGSFSLATFIANVWTDNESPINFGQGSSADKISFFENQYVDPAQYSVSYLDTNAPFQASYFLWKLSTYVQDPSQIVGDLLDERSYYMAILFALLNATTENGDYQHDISSISGQSIISLDNSLVDTLSTNDYVQAYANLQAAGLSEQSSILDKWAIAWVKNNWSTRISGVTSVIASILTYTNNVMDFVQQVSKYELLLDVSSDLIAVLEQLAENCPSGIIQQAIKDVLASCKTGFSQILFNDSAWALLNASWETLFSGLWGSLSQWMIASYGLDSIYATWAIALKLGISLGQGMSNALLSTDATLEWYARLEALCEFKGVLVNSIDSLRVAFQHERNTANASAFNKSVQMMFSLQELSADWAMQFADTAHYGSIVGPFFQKNYQSFMDYAVSGKSLISSSYKLISEMWQVALVQSYPEIYQQFARTIDTSSSNFLEPVNQVTSVPAGYTGIYTAQGLDNIRNNLNSKYILMTDINLSGWGNWTPIGGGAQSAIFTGELNGNGHVISHLAFVNQGMRGSVTVGLFGGMANASIRNLGMAYVDINVYSSEVTFLDGSVIMGGIAAVATDSTVENCFVTGSILGQTSSSGMTAGSMRIYGAGIIAQATGTSINNTVNKARVFSNDSEQGSWAGGLVATASNSSIDNSNNTGNIESYSGYTSSSYSGGIAGYASNTVFTNTSNTGVISSHCSNNLGQEAYSGGIAGATNAGQIYYSYNTGAVIVPAGWTASAGGIAGSMGGSSWLFTSFNVGQITVSAGSTANAGGLLGSSDQYLSMVNCFNVGRVTIAGSGSFPSGNPTAAGGLIGYKSSGITSTISSCYNGGAVDTSRAYYKRSGGIIGYAESTAASVTVRNSYFRDDALNAIGYNSVALSNVQALSNSMMQEMPAFVGFNFDSIWRIDQQVNSGYPYLVSSDFRDFNYFQIPIRYVDISAVAMSLSKGEQYELSASYFPVDTTDSSTPTWTSSNPSIVAVSDGRVNALDYGVAVITVSIGHAQALCIVRVEAALTSIGLDHSSLSLTTGGTGSLTVSYTPTDTTDDTTIVWSTSNPAVATVVDGVVTAVNPGTATITASVGSKTTHCIVTVTAPPVSPEIESVSVTGTPQVGQTLTASASGVAPVGATVAWQWLRDGSPISGATNASYLLTDSDAGHKLSVSATVGGTASATSTAISVEAANDLPSDGSVNIQEIIASTTGGTARFANGTDEYTLLTRLTDTDGHGIINVASRLSVDVPAEVKFSCFVDNGDGTYAISLTSNTPGNYDITILLDGQPLGNPVSVNFIGATISASEITQDSEQTALGLGFLPGEQVAVSLHSSSIDLGTFTADQSGVVTVTFKIPQGFDVGTHSIVFTGAQSGTTSVSFMVKSTIEATTGGSILPSNNHASVAMLVLITLVATLYVLVARRRASARSL